MLFILELPYFFNYELIDQGDWYYCPWNERVFHYPWLITWKYWPWIEEFIYLQWHYRRKYQSFLYRFNTHDRLNTRGLRYVTFSHRMGFNRIGLVTLVQHKWFVRFTLHSLESIVTTMWYTTAWLLWCALTYHLYFHEKVRDLGPSYDIYDYNPEDNMGIYLTIGPVLLFVWYLWTYVANSVFLKSIFFIMNKFFFIRFTWLYWHSFYHLYLYTLHFTIYPLIEVYFIDYLYNIYEINYIMFYGFITFLDDYIEFQQFVLNNFAALLLHDFQNLYSAIFNTVFLKNIAVYFSSLLPTLLWFPWSSFFNYITILGLIYILTFLSIYNTENPYYIVLYTIFLIGVFSATLVSLDLDIFAGLLLLIESVVVLMLFFLIIYLSPNINVEQKIQKWKLWSLIFIIVTLLSTYSYLNLGTTYFSDFSLPTRFLEDFYESLSDVSVSDLTGIYLTLYWTNSLLLVVIGILLLVASVICVVFVSFFAKNRNFNTNVFLDLFDIAKTCYSFIFLRKQNLTKQARGVSSTRLFTKKTFDSNLHAEYRVKQEAFEKKQKNEKK